MNNVLAFINKNKYVIIFLSCLFCFLILLKNVIYQKDMIWDTIGYALISYYLISDFMTPFIKIITNLGGVICIITVTLLSIIFIKNKRLKLLIPINLIIITMINQSLKYILQRPRPTGFRIIEETGFSFPSGHSMVSMAFYGYFIYLIYKYIKNNYLKWICIIFLTLLIIIIGTSRIYLGVHYTTDVLAGFMFSIMYLIIFINYTNKYE